jgi:opine dehydrogenase
MRIGAELIYVVGPAYSTEPFGEAVSGKLRPGQTVIVSPSSCGGALAFKSAAGLALEDDAVRVAETSTLMDRDYAAEAPRTPASLGIGGLSAEELGKL